MGIIGFRIIIIMVYALHFWHIWLGKFTSTIVNSVHLGVFRFWRNVLVNSVHLGEIRFWLNIIHSVHLRVVWLWLIVAIYSLHLRVFWLRLLTLAIYSFHFRIFWLFLVNCIVVMILSTTLCHLVLAREFKWCHRRRAVLKASCKWTSTIVW
jgi:hypothetical protein